MNFVLIIVAIVAVALVAFLFAKRKGGDAQEIGDGGLASATSAAEAKNEVLKPEAHAKDEEKEEANGKDADEDVAPVEKEETPVEPVEEEPVEVVDLSKRTRPDTNGLPYILVAEDNMSNYKLLEVMLRGVAVTENAVNGRKTVDYAKIKDYDMILMDIKMPILTGLEATKLIRKFDTNIPIIAVTANVLDFDKNMALSCGCNEFVPKPIIRKELLEVVNTYKRK